MCEKDENKQARGQKENNENKERQGGRIRTVKSVLPVYGMTTGAYVGGLVRKSMLRAHRALTPHPLPNTHAPACTLQHTHHTLAML